MITRPDQARATKGTLALVKLDKPAMMLPKVRLPLLPSLIKIRQRTQKLEGRVYFLYDLQTPVKLDNAKIWMVSTCCRSEVSPPTKFDQDQAKDTKVRREGRF